MDKLLGLLKNWQSAAAGGGVAFVIVAVIGLITDIRTLSASELNTSLQLARADLEIIKQDYKDLSTKHGRLEEAYQTLSAAFWDEPVIGWIKGRNGRYIQANKRFVEDLVIGKKLDPTKIIGYTDMEIWGDTAMAAIYAAHDQQVMRDGHMIEFHEEIEIAGEMVKFLSRKYPVYSSRGVIMGAGGVAIEDCE